MGQGFCKELNDYRSILSQNLKTIYLPVPALLCTDMCCKDADHHSAVSQYAVAITNACLAAAEACLPHTSNRQMGPRRIPGWLDKVEPLRQKSLFWHEIWVDCGRPRNGAVADCMRRSRASYHYAVRQVRRDEDSIVRERIAKALIDDPSRNFWTEVKKLRISKASTSMIVDGLADESSIAQLFASKYRSLYSSVPFDVNEMQSLLTQLDVKISAGGLCQSEHFIYPEDVLNAIGKLHLHKMDGGCGISTDHFCHAGSDLAFHIAFLFTAMIIHGCSPTEFGACTIIPIPKKQNINVADSNNFRGIALSSVFCKLFDNVILDKFAVYLRTSEHQLGFKSKHSTNMCSMILKETISYYIKNKSSVFCTFLDASKAFDRVHYCKLFRLLIERGLPPCIVRVLINLYTVNQVRVLWAGLTSDYFSALNGVKQGGVISPILFSVYIDDLLVRLSFSGVGCYVGLNFAGVRAYADDIVLIAPSPTAMRKLLAICDSYALEFDIVFNAEKSKFLVVSSPKRRHIHSALCGSRFVIGGNLIENVKQYTHLGHIICSSFLDSEDIMYRRNSLVGQTNNFLCFFSKLDSTVRLKLFKTYCSSMYGCELWNLNDDSCLTFCTTWRKALRRVLNLPYTAHSFYLPYVSNTLPIRDELCKRSARFIFSCLLSDNYLVRSISWHSVVYAKYNSFLGSNALVCCAKYGWSIDDFSLCRVQLSNSFFEQWYINSLSEYEMSSIMSLLDILSIREGYSVLPDFCKLSDSQITDIISAICTS